MKKLIYIFFGALFLNSCNDFLELKPQGQMNTENYYNSEENAIVAVNGIYDLLGQSEGKGPDDMWMNHHYEFFMGSMISDDSEKGSKPGDKPDLIELLNWSFDGSYSNSPAFWIHGFWGVSRANNVIQGLQKSDLEITLRNRLLGEAYFLRGYYYFYLLRHFGGVPLFEFPIPTSEYGHVERASLHDTFEFIISDFTKAIEYLPKKSEYSDIDLGRATQGAAYAFKARVLMYQAGIDAQVSDEKKVWEEVYKCTNAVISSGEYALVKNFGVMFELETKNCQESIFEIQTFYNGVDGAYPNSTGVGYCNFQGNRVTNEGANVGWGFNNPTQNLVDAFDPTDPRLSCTVYGIGFNNEILYGKKMKFDRTQQSTNYLNRKAALKEKPAVPKCIDFNIILMRLADVYLMHAEALYHKGLEEDARLYLNKIRKRARESAMCKGYNEGAPDVYPIPTSTPNIPDLDVSGESLLQAIWNERRLELAMENLRTYDLIRQGRFLDVIDKVKDKDRESNTGDMELQYKNCKSACMKHCLGEKDGAKVPVPVLIIPNTEVTAWGLTQNPY